MQDYWYKRLSDLSVIVLIPTYNNAKTLASVIEQVRLYAPNILVVNDGSTDNTADVLNSFTGIDVLGYPKNRGKGYALRTGLLYARTKGFRYALTIDSDGQHYADDIPVFIDEIEKTPDTLLVGARNLNADNMPSKNSFANRFSNFWYRLETGIRLEDTQSGYRLYPLHKMGKLRGYTTKYEFELEAIVYAAWRGVDVRNIPIKVYYPPVEERVSHFRPIRDFTRISILNTVLVLITLLWVLPWKFIRNINKENIRKFIHNNITHSPDSNLRLAVAVMLGVFMGIIPLWGYQMILCVALAHLLKLNKIVALVASNISIPPMIPFILYGSYALGCYALGDPVVLEITDLSVEYMFTVLTQYLLGSVILAVLAAFVLGGLSWLVLTLFRHKSSQSVTD